MLFDFINSDVMRQGRTDRHRLAGVVNVDGQPAKRLICVFHRRTKVLLATQWSNPTTGAWELAGLPQSPARDLYVVAFDDTGNFNAEIADYMTQVTTGGEVPPEIFYTPCYPPSHDSTFVKATTQFSTSYQPWFATDPALPLTGSDISTTWVSANGGNVGQKFNIDLGVARIIKRLYLENFHSSGALTEAGIMLFGVYGTNSATAFANTVYANTADLTLLGSFEARAHIPSDESDPQYFLLDNDTAYQYVVLRIADCNGHDLRMGITHIELQTEY
jgi:hypothetical protein